MTTINVATASTKELLAFFNAHTGGNQLVKFQNRTSAESRVNALIAEMEAEEQGDQKAAIAACKRGDDAIPAADYSSAAVAKRVAEAKIVEDDFNKVTEAEHAAHRVETVKPYIRAKAIVADCIAKGITTRKEILAACVAQGIKLNTADGAHYEMCVRKG